MLELGVGVQRIIAREAVGGCSPALSFCGFDHFSSYFV
jgi:hypothetical protein